MTASQVFFGNWMNQELNLEDKTELSQLQKEIFKSQEKRNAEEKLRRMLLPSLNEVFAEEELGNCLKKRLPIFVEISRGGSY